MTQKKSNTLKGYSCSLIGAVANSQYFFVLKVLVLSAAIVSNNGDSKFIFPFCLFIVIEFFNLVFNIFAFGGTKFLDSIKTMFTYDGFFLFCCGIIGGPLGAACNLLCVFYAGPIIGILFSLLPALATTIFNRIFLKDRITTMAWISIFLTLAGVVGYSCFDLFDENSLSITTDKILIGVIFGFLNCFFWGLEVTILDFVYRKGTGKIKPVSQPVALNIKFTTSVLTALLVIPLLDVSSSTNYDLGYYYLKSMFLDKKLFIINVAIASLVLYLVRFGLYFGTFFIKGIYTQFLILAGVILNPLFLYIYSNWNHDLVTQWNDFKVHWYKFFFILMAVSGITSFILLKDKNIKFAHNLKFFFNKK